MNQAIRYLNSLVYLSVRVKPNSRAGSRIIGVDDEVVELAVSAKPQDGEANRAVRELVADVLGVPKSDVEVVRGMKSREKTLSVVAESWASCSSSGSATSGKSVKGKKDADTGSVDGELIVQRVEKLLLASAEPS